MKPTRLTNQAIAIKLRILINYICKNAEKRRVRNPPHEQRLPEAEKEA